MVLEILAASQVLDESDDLIAAQLEVADDVIVAHPEQGEENRGENTRAVLACHAEEHCGVGIIGHKPRKNSADCVATEVDHVAKDTREELRGRQGSRLRVGVPVIGKERGVHDPGDELRKREGQALAVVPKVDNG